MYEKYAVLFVDDEVNILNSLRRGLMDEEYESFFAGSGKEALEIMKKHQVHVIITDMRMPEMNGLDLLKVISEENPTIVKLILSGYTQLPQILATINQVDIFKFITKPWSLDELIAIIRKALDFCIIQEENIKYKSILEQKNVAYQNILKRMDDVIQDAKKSSQLLGRCGKVILGFGKNFSLNDRIKYQNVFNIQDELFESITKAVIGDVKEYRNKDIFRIIEESFPHFKFNPITNNALSYKININILYSIYEIISKIFQEEFGTYGLVSSLEDDKKMKFSIICPKVCSSSVAEDKITMLNIKTELVKRIMNELLSNSNITFQALMVNGSLIIGIVVNE